MHVHEINLVNIKEWERVPRDKRIVIEVYCGYTSIFMSKMIFGYSVISSNTFIFEDKFRNIFMLIFCDNVDLHCAARRSVNVGQSLIPSTNGVICILMVFFYNCIHYTGSNLTSGVASIIKV